MNNQIKEQISPPVVIIGAGLTGLSLAHYLRKEGVSVHILEKSPRTGGVIDTKVSGHFCYETGPCTGVLSSPELVELLEDLSPNCEVEIANPKAKKRFIWKGDRWRALPSSLKTFIQTPLFSTYDKFRILGEPFRKRGNNPMESVSSMVKRRLGKSYLEYGIDPFIAGVYSGNPSYLVTQYAFPKLYSLEQTHGSLIRGAIQKRKIPKTEREKKATKEVFTTRGGLVNLVRTLTEKVGKEHIDLCVSNIQVVPKKEEMYEVSYEHEGVIHRIETSTVVSTVGAYALPTLFPFLSEKLLSPITSLKYAAVVTVNLGFDEWEGKPLEGFGGLVPSKEKRRILGVLFPSVCFEGRAPKSGALLTVFLGAERYPSLMSLKESEIQAIVKEELIEMFELKHYHPSLVEVRRYPNAIAQYGADSEKRLEHIDLLEHEYKGLFFGGNINDGIGMADRVKQATKLALQIQEYRVNKNKN